MSEYDLGESAKGLGKLVPIIKAKDGSIIDGFHRQNCDPDWPTITVESIDSPVKLELARLAANYCRRTIPENELRTRIRFLVNNGLRPDDIAEQTGISLVTIYSHMPQELKDEKKAKAGRIGGKASGASRLKQTVKTYDTPKGNGKDSAEQKPGEASTDETDEVEAIIVCPLCGKHVMIRCGKGMHEIMEA